MDLWDATTLDTELNYTEPDNDTVVVEERWRQVLDNVNTIIMTSNTITLMLGMGAAISVMEVRAGSPAIEDNIILIVEFCYKVCML